MDVCEPEQPLKKHSEAETSRLPLAPADKNDGATRRPRTKEVSSRYMSLMQSAPRRCPSPCISRAVNETTHLVPKRATSAERKRPSTPSSLRRPSTPVQDTSTEIHLASRKVAGSRLPEVLWPSTMRSLTVSFQSDTISVPITKKEKPVAQSLSDRALRPSSNVAQKTTPASRQPTPERKRSPLKVKTATDQSENSKPVDGMDARLVDQHLWPSRSGVKITSNALRRSMDLSDKVAKPSAASNLGTGISSSRRMSLPDSFGRPLQKSANDAVSLVSFDDLQSVELDGHSVDDNQLLDSRLHKVISSHSSKQLTVMTPAIRSQSLSTSGSRPPSPNKSSFLSSSVSRGSSPSRSRILAPASSRGVSPSRIRQSSPSRQSTSSTTSVLSFVADIRKGKKVANHLEDVHQLRLLYNRHLQWRYANAKADATLQRQKNREEKTLYNVWKATSELWGWVIEKRTDLQQLRLKLELYSLLKEQIDFLDDWASIEKDHTCSLSWAMEDLQSSILRVPLTAGARAEIQTVNAAIWSAVNLVQSMGSSIYSRLSRVEGMNSLVAELANVAAQERLKLDECGALLASIAAMQVEEYSLRTHLIQLKQALEESELPDQGLH